MQAKYRFQFEQPDCDRRITVYADHDRLDDAVKFLNEQCIDETDEGILFICLDAKDSHSALNGLSVALDREFEVSDVIDVYSYEKHEWIGAAGYVADA